MILRQYAIVNGLILMYNKKELVKDFITIVALLLFALIIYNLTI